MSEASSPRSDTEKFKACESFRRNLASSNFKMTEANEDTNLPDNLGAAGLELGLSVSSKMSMDEWEKYDKDTNEDADILTFQLSNLNMSPLPTYSYQWEQPSKWNEDGHVKPRSCSTPLPVDTSSLTSISNSLNTMPTLPPSLPSLTEQSLERLLQQGLHQDLTMNGFDQSPLSLQVPADLPKRLHISNIPFRFREQHLVQLLGQFGKVTAAEIIYNEKGSKGFGFVTMARGRDADMATLGLHGTVVEGRIVEVNLATKKTSGSRTQLPPMTNFNQGPGTTIIWRKTDRPPPVLPFRTFSPPATPQALVEAQARLAEAQLAVLQIEQQLLCSNHTRVDIGATGMKDYRMGPRVQAQRSFW